MKLTQLMAGVCALGFLAAGALAQDQSGTVAAIEFQTPKNGMTSQYEQGRKTKAAWQKEQGGKTPLLVSQIISGERMGTYVVGQFGMHWADFDHPSISDEADLAEYNKTVGPYVEKLMAQYYEFLPEWSNPEAAGTTPKYLEVLTFHIRFGKGDEFQSAVAKVNEANKKLNVPGHASWYRLVNGGRSGTYVLTLDHADWASFAPNPAVKPIPERLREAFGEQEATKVMGQLDDSIASIYTEIAQPRPDLSYIPAQ